MTQFKIEQLSIDYKARAELNSLRDEITLMKHPSLMLLKTYTVMFAEKRFDLFRLYLLFIRKLFEVLILSNENLLEGNIEEETVYQEQLLSLSKILMNINKLRMALPVTESPSEQIKPLHNLLSTEDIDKINLLNGGRLRTGLGLNSHRKAHYILLDTLHIFLDRISILQNLIDILIRKASRHLHYNKIFPNLDFNVSSEVLHHYTKYLKEIYDLELKNTLDDDLDPWTTTSEIKLVSKPKLQLVFQTGYALELDPMRGRTAAGALPDGIASKLLKSEVLSVSRIGSFRQLLKNIKSLPHADGDELFHEIREGNRAQDLVRGLNTILRETLEHQLTIPNIPVPVKAEICTSHSEISLLSVGEGDDI